MSRECCLSGKSSIVGNRVSHAKNRTKVRLYPNVQKKRLYVPSLKKFITLKISTTALRSIDKIGIEAYAAKQGFILK
jgi:large subunit ribosomal protein L28